MNIRTLLCAAALASCASATNLSTNMTVDNGFTIYISTSDSVLGTQFGTGSDWQTTYNFSTALTPGVTNYIHVVATNAGGPAGFIGDFSLDDALFQFSNGTQSLFTNSADWGSVPDPGFGGPYTPPVEEGPNGVSPWGTRPNISADAQWIWDPTNCVTCDFSTAITPLDTGGAAPEPSTIGMLGAGAALIFASRRNRKK